MGMGKGIGEMWRVSEDIIATTEGTAYWGGASILKIIDIMAPLWPYAGPGHWNRGYAPGRQWRSNIR